MPTQKSIDQAVKDFNETVQHLKDEYSKLQIGRASTALVEELLVASYGTTQPLKAIATLSIPDPKTIQIQPWDKGNLATIENTIRDSDLNLSPVNDGNVVRINIPPMTEERRQDLTKLVHKLAEDGRITVRNHRQTAHTAFKQLQTDSAITEDDFYDADKKLQVEVDKVNKEIEELAKKKEEDILTV